MIEVNHLELTKTVENMLAVCNGRSAEAIIGASFHMISIMGDREEADVEFKRQLVASLEKLSSYFASQLPETVRH